MTSLSAHALVSLLMITAAISQPGRAHEPQGQPGDMGYRHDEYHKRGLIEELERKVGHSCCDGARECRATTVDMTRRKAFIDGRWCPIGFRTSIRKDIVLPDHFALVCAGVTTRPQNPCPPIYCIALSPGT